MMKNVIYLSLVVFIALSCKKEEMIPDENATQYAFSETVTQQREVLATIITRTECGACGEWGHPTFDQKISSDNRINGIALHFRDNDPMANEDASAWVDKIGWSGTPSFGVGLSSQNSDSTAWKDAIATKINENLIAAIGIQGEGNTAVNLNVTVQFFEAFTQPTALSIYLVEDGFVAEQKDYSSTPTTVEDYVHNQILRKSITNVWGNNLGNSFTADQTIEKSFNFSTESVHNLANMKIVAVLFETDEQGNPLNVINSKTSKAAVLSM